MSHKARQTDRQTPHWNEWRYTPTSDLQTNTYSNVNTTKPQQLTTDVVILTQ